MFCCSQLFAFRVTCVHLKAQGMLRYCCIQTFAGAQRATGCKVHDACFLLWLALHWYRTLYIYNTISSIVVQQKNSIYELSENTTTEYSDIVCLIKSWTENYKTAKLTLVFHGCVHIFLFCFCLCAVCFLVIVQPFDLNITQTTFFLPANYLKSGIM